MSNLKLLGALLLTVGGTTQLLYAEQPSVIINSNIVQQKSTCSGVVKDASGESVIGASVLVKGTTIGTITDFDGNFELPNVEKGAFFCGLFNQRSCMERNSNFSRTRRRYKNAGRSCCCRIRNPKKSKSNRFCSNG